MTLRIVGAVLLAYLLGSIPTSYLVVRAVKGIDLRKTGSGNLGATNLFRTLGWAYALPVALFDMAKGAIPVMLLGPWAGLGYGGSVLLGLVAVVGHVFSVFMRFKGGKGVATGGGVVLGLAPGAFVLSLAVWAIIVKLSGYVSLGSVIAAFLLPIAAWFLAPSHRDLVPWLALLCLMVIWLHRANIARLIKGTENRFGRKMPTPPPGAA
jgi:acyl phosphate:glycerol-3-phosphate acyltransferase